MNVLQESLGKLSGLAQLQALIATGRRPPIADTLDFNLVEIDTGRAVFAATPGPHAYNPLGTIHGGYAATLLDSACGCAVHSTLSAVQGYTSLELKVAYHKAMTAETGPIRAEAKVITVGKRVAFTEGRIVDAAGTVYASATSTLLVFDLPPAKAA
ncbi:uncharacterized domain 1-containing protein [Andreprevotia lacus DSM 23236]|jgi:uncharacterized protein (TIGR00369 family)|uniref:Uncharacterized domain 1-containing protein n=1 Tax=Andreprevotia lacus DSM 23236 TaxID=1121001 RepID=A0A1W1XE65_9NEIS|nr:PaaI family thioesterase [Andreprevotia lacus]SMC22177.1 uncharacterized domain 1-containing protein [Andreprevotia lacus DSM 23236]